MRRPKKDIQLTSYDELLGLEETPEKSMNQVVEIDLAKLYPFKNHPFHVNDDEKMAETVESIKTYGVLTPALVRPRSEGGYEMISGHRRKRGCELCGKTTMPALVRNYTDDEAVIIMVDSNIQRENLSAIEEAKSYVDIMRFTGVNQSELALRVGKSQSAIANKIRLLQLDENIQNAVSAHQITERHARALLGLDSDKQQKMLDTIVKKGLNVSQTEKAVKQEKLPKEEKKKVMLKGISKNVKIAVNTIHQAVAMVKRAGVDAKVSQEELEDDVIITIRIPK